MAEDNSAGAVFIELGLDLNNLESDFIAADQTIQQNLNRLNRERNLIELRAQVEIGGLDETTDAEQILEVRTRSLNQQMQIQRDRIQLVEAAHRQLVNSQGESATATQNMEARLQRERLMLQRLEQQLRQTTQAQENLSIGGNGNGNSGVSGLSDLLDGVLDKIPPQARMAATAIAGIGTAVFAAGKASKELIEDWRELQKQAYELNMTVNDTENFLRHMRLAGGDIGDWEGFVRGVSDALVKGETDDVEWMVFKKYGGNPFDAQGRLKDFQALTEEIKKMYRQAKAAGEEIEFLQMLGGESGVRDGIQYLERYEEAKEDAEKIFDAGLDPEELHKADRALNLLTEQVDEFKDALANLATPATTEAMEGLFKVFKNGTEFLAEQNKELREMDRAFFDWLSDDAKNEDHLQELFKTSEGLAKAHEQLKAKRDKNPLNQYSIQRTNDLKDELAELKLEIENFNKDYDLKLAQLDLWHDRSYRQIYMSDDESAVIEELYGAKIEQLEQEREDRLSDIRDAANAKFQTNLENQLVAIEKQKDDWISAGMEEAEAETLAQRQKAKTIEDLERSWNERVLAINGSALEQKLANIEREKQAWIQKGISEEDAENLAEIQKSKAVEEENLKLANDESDAQNKINDLLQNRTGTLEEIDNLYEQYYEHVRKTVAQVQSIWQTELEQRLVQIDQEAETFKKAMVEEEAVAKWAAQAKVDAERNAAMQILKSQLQAYRAFERGGYEALKRYELNQLYKQGITQKDLQMTPEQLQKFTFAQKAVQNSLMPNFMTDIDFRRQLAAKNGASDFKLPEIPVGMPKDMKERLNSLNERLDDLNKEIAKANENLKDLGKNRGGLSNSLEKSRSDSDALQRQMSQLNYSPERNSTISSLPPQDTPERTARISELNQKIADLTAAFNSNSITQPTSRSENLAGNVTPSLTTNVSINEAHAWDSERIQELAEKVAGEIESRISREIGGDLNSY